MKHFSLRLAILIAVLVPRAALGQPVDPADYYPLRGGNSWTYYDVLHPPASPPDTSIVGTFTIADSIIVNDTLYFKARHPSSLADTLRSDDGRIYARVHGQDVLLFDFLMAADSSYVFEYFGTPEEDDDYVVTIERDVVVEVRAGRFENCLRFEFDVPLMFDETRTFIFAPGVGLVTSYGGHGEAARLYSAIVGSSDFPSSIEEGVEGQPYREAYAYPNPFDVTTTVILSRSGSFATGGPARDAVVHDLLGREVAVLTADGCDLQACSYSFAGAGFPSGVYFARLRDDPTAPVAWMVLRR